MTKKRQNQMKLKTAKTNNFYMERQLFDTAVAFLFVDFSLRVV